MIDNHATRSVEFGGRDDTAGRKEDAAGELAAQAHPRADLLVVFGLQFVSRHHLKGKIH